MTSGIYQARERCQVKQYNKKPFTNHKEFFFWCYVYEGQVTSINPNFHKLLPNVCILNRFGQYQIIEDGDLIAIYPNGLEKVTPAGPTQFELISRNF